jgi:hypothetical protein
VLVRRGGRERHDPRSGSRGHSRGRGGRDRLHLRNACRSIRRLISDSLRRSRSCGLRRRHFLAPPVTAGNSLPSSS